jgi:hypothetical protein
MRAVPLVEEYVIEVRRLVGNFLRVFSYLFSYVVFSYVAFSHIAFATAHNILHSMKPCGRRFDTARLAEVAAE